jgi:prophage tail gpP-like protein
MPFNPAEVASLTVEGVSFQDWETVWVQHRWADGWPLFRFTAAEEATMPTSWGALQFKPGDACTITLGGQLAITGIILTRQTAYDATNHQVELAGAGRTWAAGTSSVPADDANFDKMPLQAIANKVYGKNGVAVLPVGTVDATPFEKCQAQPGELCFDLVDKLARQRGATLGSDHLGNMLLIGDHSNPIVQQLREGQNILKMQCVISNEMMASVYNAVGQGSNAENMSAAVAAKMEAEVTSSNYKGYRKFIQTVLEHPAMSFAEVQSRAHYEALFRDGTQIRANVTVQGWLRDGVNLWRCGDDVDVQAPMAMLDFTMKIQTLTFQQDTQGGTTTVLELVMPWKLADKPFGAPDSPANAPQAPPPALAIGPGPRVPPQTQSTNPLEPNYVPPPLFPLPPP